MEEHLRYAALGRYCYEGMKLVGALLLAAYLSSTGIWKELSGDGLMGLLSQFLMLMLLSGFALIAIGLLAAYGMMQRLPWGRTLGTVVNVLDLFFFPIGTLLGGYSLWVLFQPQTAELFRQPTSSAPL